VPLKRVRVRSLICACAVRGACAVTQTRVVKVRTGIVLGRDGGALASMLPSFQFGMGNVMGDGRQYFPWVHLDDIVGLYEVRLKFKCVAAVRCVRCVRCACAVCLHKSGVFRAARGCERQRDRSGQRRGSRCQERPGYVP
jgi:hypothetical protein